MNGDRPAPIEEPHTGADAAAVAFSSASEPPAAPPAVCSPIPIERKALFLDDDPARASAFLRDRPSAVWVTTVANCLARLDESWDEVHLDHDLGGRTDVEMHVADCGMEVVRWLCRESRTHLAHTQFIVHTHNFMAGLFMVLRMRERGYMAEFRPFGDDLARLLRHDDPEPPAAIAPEPEPERSTPQPTAGKRARLLGGIVRWFQRLRSRRNR